jgi:hypothetical protein
VNSIATTPPTRQSQLTRVELVARKRYCNTGMRTLLGYFDGAAGLEHCAAACAKVEGCAFFGYSDGCYGSSADAGCGCYHHRGATAICDGASQSWATDNAYNYFRLGRGALPGMQPCLPACPPARLPAPPLCALPPVQAAHDGRVCTWVVLMLACTLRLCRARVCADAGGAFVASSRSSTVNSMRSKGATGGGNPRVDDVQVTAAEYFLLDRQAIGLAAGPHPWPSNRASLDVAISPAKLGGGTLFVNIQVWYSKSNASEVWGQLTNQVVMGDRRHPYRSGSLATVNGRRDELGLFSPGTTVRVLGSLAGTAEWNPHALPGTATAWQIAHANGCSSQRCVWTLDCGDPKLRASVALTASASERGFDFIHAIDGGSDPLAASAVCNREYCPAPAAVLFSGSGEAGLASQQLTSATGSLALVYWTDSSELAQRLHFSASVTCPRARCTVPVLDRGHVNLKPAVTAATSNTSSYSDGISPSVVKIAAGYCRSADRLANTVKTAHECMALCLMTAPSTLNFHLDNSLYCYCARNNANVPCDISTNTQYSAYAIVHYFVDNETTWRTKLPTEQLPAVHSRAGLYFEAFCRSSNGDTRPALESILDTALDPVWNGWTPCHRLAATEQKIFFTNSNFNRIPGWIDRDYHFQRWRGQIYIAATTTYEFRLSIDDGGYIFIGGAQVGGSSTSGTVSMNANLIAGWQDITLVYIEHTSTARLNLEWRRANSGSSFEALTAEYLRARVKNVCASIPCDSGDCIATVSGGHICTPTQRVNLARAQRDVASALGITGVTANTQAYGASDSSRLSQLIDEIPRRGLVPRTSNIPVYQQESSAPVGDAFITVDLGKVYALNGVTLWHSGGMGDDGAVHPPGRRGSNRYLDPRVAVSLTGEFEGEEQIVSPLLTATSTMMMAARRIYLLSHTLSVMVRRGAITCVWSSPTTTAGVRAAATHCGLWHGGSRPVKRRAATI